MKKKLLAYLATTYTMWQRGYKLKDKRYTLQWLRYQGQFEGAREIANALGYRVVIRDDVVRLERNSNTKRKAC